MDGETESSQEPEPKRYFKVRNVDILPSGFGFIPEEVAERLIDERFPISSIETPEGEDQIVVVQAEDIALSLGMDGTDPSYNLANWWDGYSAAYKSRMGEVQVSLGEIRFHISSGDIQEGEEDPDIA